MIQTHIEKLLCKNKLLILKGNISGYFEKFIEPIINPVSLNNFAINPITTSYLSIKAYIIISKTEDKSNPFYYIQIVYEKNNKNLLELGLGILTDNKLKFNMTETSSTLGFITYNCKKDIFHVNRFSLPPNLIFIDQGNFSVISMGQFEQETGIKV